MRSAQIAALLGEPVLDDGEPLAVEHARAHPPGLRGADQPVRLEGAHVLHERRERHRELAGELADARRGLAQPSDHGTAGRVRQRDEHPVELLRILSHAG